MSECRFRISDSSRFPKEVIGPPIINHLAVHNNKELPVARTDVTDRTVIHYLEPEEEIAWITQCVCGAKFDSWSEHIGIYDTVAWKCPECGARLYFGTTTHVYQVTDEPG